MEASNSSQISVRYQTQTQTQTQMQIKQITLLQSVHNKEIPTY